MGNLNVSLNSVASASATAAPGVSALGRGRGAGTGLAGPLCVAGVIESVLLCSDSDSIGIDSRVASSACSASWISL